MAGLLDYGTDPLGQGLLAMGASMMTPRALGGGLAPGLLAFNQGAMQAQQYRRALDQDARRSRLIDAQIGEIGAQADQRKAQMRALEAKTQAIANARASIAQTRPDMLPFFDADPEGALKQLYAQPTLVEVPTEGGGTSKQWLKPGETAGPQVGATVAPELKPIGGRMVNPRAMAPNTPINDPNDLMHIGPDGGLVLNSTLAGAKASIAGAGAAKNMTLVNAYEPASVAAQKSFMEGMQKSYDSLSTAGPTLTNIERAKALVPQVGGFAGSFGDKKLEIAKFFNNNLGTAIDPGGVASAEELRSRLFVQIMDNLKKMDAQPSEMQQRVMQDALGKITTDPAAIPRVLDVFKEVITEKVNLHNTKAEQAIGNGVKFPFDPRIQLPKPAQAPEAAKPAPQTFSMLPNASEHNGKTIRDTVSGKRYRSQGGKWVEVGQ